MINKEAIASDFNKKYNLSNDDADLLHFAKVTNENYTIVGQPTTYTRDILKRFFTNKIAVFFLVVLIIIIILSIVIPWTSPYSSTATISEIDSNYLVQLPTSKGGVIVKIIDLDELNDWRDLEKTSKLKIINIIDENNVVNYNPYLLIQAISKSKEPLEAIIGTDDFGRDLWLTTWEGTRNALFMSFCVALITFIVGTFIGTYLGFHIGNKIDTIFMRFIEIFESAPSFLMFLILVQIMGSGLLQIGLILILLNWTTPVYSARVYIIGIKDEEFLSASKAVGASKLRIIYLEALPQVIGKILPTFTNSIISGIFSLSSIAFLGIVVDSLKTAPNLGNIVISARHLFDINIWATIVPTIILSLITVSLKIVSVAIHDALDPKAKRL